MTDLSREPPHISFPKQGSEQLVDSSPISLPSRLLEDISEPLARMDIVAYNPLITHLVKYLQSVPIPSSVRTLANSAGCWTRQDLSNSPILGSLLFMVLSLSSYRSSKLHSIILALRDLKSPVFLSHVSNRRYLYRKSYPAASIAPYNAAKINLGIVRKALRVGKNIEHFKAAAIALQSPLTKVPLNARSTIDLR